MLKINKIIIIILILIYLMSCSNSKKIIDKKSVSNTNPSKIYLQAIEDLKKEDYDNSTDKFKKILSEFPLSNEGIQSQIMLAFIDYVKLDYDEAIYKFNKIIKFYPSYNNIDYAYYMVALCYYEQIENETLDGANNDKALKNFNEILNRFPESDYSKDSTQKIIFIKENIAAKNMDIASFYLKQKKYIAALNRYNIIINEHKKSKFVPEALYRMVEIYVSLGMTKEANKTASIISYNYPDSKWYRYAYNIINEDNIKKNKFKIKNILSNFFN